MKWSKRLFPEPHIFCEEINEVICFCEDKDGDLLAAAPELLLACEGALVALQLGVHVDQKQAIDYLGEVIVKAKGLQK